MKLDRNITKPKRGKYALIKLRRDPITETQVSSAITNEESVLVDPHAVDFGNTSDTDFFVIRLKDKYAEPALRAYAKAARQDDSEYANEIAALADSARYNKNKRRPD